LISKDITIINKLGLHARAAAKLVALASNYQSEIEIEKEGKKINGKSIMGVMMLAANQNSIITITISGEDEDDAMNSIVYLFNNYFDEDE
jgi:phosphocarrier protein